MLTKQRYFNRIIGRRICGSLRCKFSRRDSSSRKFKISCDNCGSDLIQRPDDTEEKVSVRLNVYNDVTKPIMDFYRDQDKFFAVNGNGSSEEVYQRLLETVSQLSQ